MVEELNKVEVEHYILVSVLRARKAVITNLQRSSEEEQSLPNDDSGALV